MLFLGLTCATRSKIFSDDIKRLLSMSDMWKTRRPPVPLDYHAILAGTFSTQSPSPPPVTNGSKETTVLGKRKAPPEKERGNGEQKSEAFEQQGGLGGLKDQKDLSLRDNTLLFEDRCVDLAIALYRFDSEILVYVAA